MLQGPQLTELHRKSMKKTNILDRTMGSPVSFWLMMLISASTLVLASTGEPTSSSRQSERHRRLQLELQDTSDDDISTFKILQITDLHLGEAPESEWGPRQDEKTYKVLDSIIPAENPDLIVLSGDQVTGNDIYEGAAEVYRRLCEKLETYGIPWAMIFGNHDDMPYEYYDEELIQTGRSRTSREDLFEIDHSFAPLSQTKLGPAHLFGTSNYILDVHQGSDVALQILFLDSGGGTLPQQLEFEQIEWFRYERYEHRDVPLVAFQHIPTKDFKRHDDDRCEGMQDQGVSPIKEDPGLVEALMDDGNAKFLAVGHNHGNAYCCPIQNSDEMNLCFGRHTGYGGFGNWDRGGRVYEIQFYKSKPGKINWKSWVRMESGDVIDEYNPPLQDTVDGDNEDEG